MHVPIELRPSPPEETLAWVASRFGADARLGRVRRLRNAWASAVHAIDVVDAGRVHRVVLRRWARTDLAIDDGVVENEAAALAMLASLDSVAVPRLVAADPAGAHTDVPALLMTRLDGTDVLDPPDVDAWVEGLVAALRAVHSVALRERTLPGYRPWRVQFAAPPEWSNRPAAWHRALEIAHEPPPDVATVLCHRDFWPGNVLWRGGRVTGIVDWTHACRGPAAVDVAHCRMNLALLFGIDVADEFAGRYGPVAELATFDLLDALSWALEPADVWRWHDAGRTDLTYDVLTTRMDEFVAAAAGRL